MVACSNGGAAHRTSATARAWAPLDPDVWAESQRIEASDSQLVDGFGTAIAMSGTTALVGAQGHDSATGAAYVLVRSGASWVEQQKLADSSLAPDDEFGLAVALDGDTALATTNTQGTGSYVFVRSGSSWTQQQKLLPSDGAPGNKFGVSAALSGDTALLGATPDTSSTAPGAAYVFVRSGTTWTQQQKLVPDDSTAGDGFGISVALDGDTALVGGWTGYTTAGAVYVFSRSSTVWTQQQKLAASNASPGDRFGSKLALDGDTAVVGASNAAYVLVRSGTTWSLQQELQASDAQASLGTAVAVTGDTALVGGVLGTAGAAFVFQRSGTTWNELQALQPAESDVIEFGSPLAIEPGLALVGATKDENNTLRGNVVAFDLGPPDGSACTSDAGCASSHCVDGVCCNTPCTGACDACSAAAGGSVDGKCSVVAKGSPGSPSCAPATCNGTSADCPCRSNGDCAAGQTCIVATGNCAAPGAPGTACNKSSACTSGSCVDGVCCDSPCAGACETCSVAKGALQAGKCSPLPAGAAGNGTCGSYRCDGKSGLCPTRCDSDATCARGLGCSSQGQCIPPQGACSADLSRSIGLDGGTGCAPYICDRNGGVCLYVCADDKQCASGYVCNDQFRCVPRGADGGVEAGAVSYYPDSRMSGCGCRAVGRRRSGGAPLVLLLGLLALGAGRRETASGRA